MVRPPTKKILIELKVQYSERAQLLHIRTSWQYEYQMTSSVHLWAFRF